jgi:hypothetical protein
MKQEIRRNLKYKKILKKVLERQNSILKIWLILNWILLKNKIKRIYIRVYLIFLYIFKKRK